MCGLGMPELVIILVIALVIFGGSRLPQLGEGLGKAIRGFKKGLSEDDKADDAPKVDPVKTIDHQPPSTAGATMGSGAPATAGAPSDTRKVG